MLDYKYKKHHTNCCINFLYQLPLFFIYQ